VAVPSRPIDSRKYADLASEYQACYDSCRIKEEKLNQVDEYCKNLKRYRSRYEPVGNPLGIPWYFIGIIHALESTFNFDTHLHNGDPLTGRTINEPKDRPERGEPPFEWEESARDALAGEGFANKSDWSIPMMLYRLEAYNGFGYRSKKIFTPYLWSFSNHYIKGKYVRDHEFSENAVSRQCGATVILRRLVYTGVVAL